MSDTGSNDRSDWWGVWAFIISCFVVFLICFFILHDSYSDMSLIIVFAIVWTVASVAFGPFWIAFWIALRATEAYLDYRDRPDAAFKSGDVLDDKTLDIYTPVRTLNQLDKVTSISHIEEVGKYAECPYCGSNIRETFYEHGGIVRCDKCSAFHHRECFEYYGNKCGSSSCKLREA